MQCNVKKLFSNFSFENGDVLFPDYAYLISRKISDFITPYKIYLTIISLNIIREVLLNAVNA